MFAKPMESLWDATSAHLTTQSLAGVMNEKLI